MNFWPYTERRDFTVFGRPSHNLCVAFPGNAPKMNSYKCDEDHES